MTESWIIVSISTYTSFAILIYDHNLNLFTTLSINNGIQCIASAACNEVCVGFKSKEVVLYSLPSCDIIRTYPKLDGKIFSSSGVNNSYLIGTANGYLYTLK